MRRAVDRFDKVSDRNVAWSSRVNVGADSASGSYLTDVRDNYNTMCAAYRCAYEAFYAMKRLFATFVCIYMCTVITWYSAQIIHISSYEHKAVYVSITLAFFVLDVIPLFVLQSITSDLQTIHRSINGFYFKNTLQNLQQKTRLLLFASGHCELNFNCYFFDAEIALLSFICELVALLVFAVCN